MQEVCWKDSNIQKYSLDGEEKLKDINNVEYSDFTLDHTDASLETNTKKNGIGIYSPTNNVKLSSRIRDNTDI